MDAIVIPLTEEQVQEYELELLPHHVVALASDKQDILKADTASIQG